MITVITAYEGQCHREFGICKECNQPAHVEEILTGKVSDTGKLETRNYWYCVSCKRSWETSE